MPGTLLSSAVGQVEAAAAWLLATAAGGCVVLLAAALAPAAEGTDAAAAAPASFTSFGLNGFTTTCSVLRISARQNGQPCPPDS